MAPGNKEWVSNSRDTRKEVINVEKILRTDKILNFDMKDVREVAD